MKADMARTMAILALLLAKLEEKGLLTAAEVDELITKATPAVFDVITAQGAKN